MTWLGLEMETCGYSREVSFFCSVLCCVVMAEQHLDGFPGLLGESFVGSSDSELGSMAFYIKQMEPKTLMWDHWENRRGTVQICRTLFYIWYIHAYIYIYT